MYSSGKRKIARWLSNFSSTKHFCFEKYIIYTFCVVSNVIQLSYGKFLLIFLYEMRRKKIFSFKNLQIFRYDILGIQLIEQHKYSSLILQIGKLHLSDQYAWDKTKTNKKAFRKQFNLSTAYVCLNLYPLFSYQFTKWHNI